MRHSLLVLILVFAWGTLASAREASPTQLPTPSASKEAPPHAHDTPWERTALVGMTLIGVITGAAGQVNPVIMAVAIGGALGSVSRYLLSQGVGHWMEQDFPYGTLAVNVLGSFAFGGISGWAAAQDTTPDAAWLALVTTGFLGGFTTFSLFAHDTVSLAHNEGIFSATLYTMLSVGVSVAALLTGEFVGSGGALP